MKLRYIVEANGKHYCIDSCYTFDHGYETMVFYCDEYGNITNWLDLYCEQYDTEGEMETGHMEIIEKIKEGLIL